MADLLVGSSSGNPATTNGHMPSSSRPTAPPAQTGSPGQIRGPRVIMQQRAEREARQRAEKEQMERARAEQEAHALEEARRRQAENNRQAAAAAAEQNTRREYRRQGEQQGGQRIPVSAPPASAQVPEPTAVPPPLRPTRVPTTPQAPQQQTFTQDPAPGTAPAGTAPAPAPTNDPSAQNTSQPGASRLKNSFPHAFERWEALSAHWEGMTSFWLRRLQENTDEAERNPITAQLSRQVADLSAAGANLFHAVVELQRLRASSERKFQRWFFETRAELERHQEVNAMLESQLEQERQARSEVSRGTARHEAENVKLQKLVTEMRKELLISKEEARRAWEELGRREQEERDRTHSLQLGQPTIIGGVQVLPMTHAGLSRGTTLRDPPPRAQAADTSAYVAAQGQYPDYSRPPEAPPATTSAGGSSGGYYPQQQQQPPHAPEAGDYGGGSEAGYSEGEYVIDQHGNFVLDAHGNRIPFHSPVATPAGATRSDARPEDYEPPVSQNPTSYPPSSSQWAATHQSAPEYSGAGYAAPGWDTMRQHHHPTRLSDVLEEDELSRTSASQVSRA